MLLTSFKSLIFFGLTEPPYRTLGVLFLNLLLINLTVSKRSFDLGMEPLPIAHTGSYAIKTFDLFLILFKPILICLDKIDLVFFFRFSLKVSPTQKITFNFALMALLILRLIN